MKNLIMIALAAHLFISTNIFAGDGYDGGGGGSAVAMSFSTDGFNSGGGGLSSAVAYYKGDSSALYERVKMAQDKIRMARRRPGHNPIPSDPNSLYKKMYETYLSSRKAQIVKLNNVHNVMMKDGRVFYAEDTDPRRVFDARKIEDIELRNGRFVRPSDYLRANTGTSEL